MSQYKMFALRTNMEVYDEFKKRHEEDIASGKKPKGSLNSAIEHLMRKDNDNE